MLEGTASETRAAATITAVAESAPTTRCRDEPKEHLLRNIDNPDEVVLV